MLCYRVVLKYIVIILWAQKLQSEDHTSLSTMLLPFDCIYYICVIYLNVYVDKHKQIY